MEPSAARTWSALAVVYVVWGSTYLAITYVVAGLPPLLTAGARFAVAAALMAVFVLVRRGTAPFRTGWRPFLGAAGIGLLLLLGGNGGVTVAEDHHLPSGLTALLVAVVPLYVVLLRFLTGDQPPRRTLVGVGIGILGLALLLLPGSRPQGVSVLFALLVLFSSGCWSVGSFAAGKLQLPSDALVTTIYEMLGGAAGLAVLGALRGERLHPADVRLSAVLGWVYLVVFGSVVAFTAYSWLLSRVPVSKVATYAYVNPIVAVALGAAVRGEPVTVVALVGGLVTVAAVAVVVSAEHRTRVVESELVTT